jgi:hypothetical protein
MWIQIIASILILYIGHLCWNYLKKRYSKEKNRDLVKLQTQKYQNIIDEMRENLKQNPTVIVEQPTVLETAEMKIAEPSMEEDLENFMRQFM